MTDIGYKNDVFISYRRGKTQTLSWLKSHFVPALEHHLALHLEDDPKIFFDEQIKAGRNWKNVLAQEIACSKVLICLWTKTYLNSDWCRRELAHMLKRQQTIYDSKISDPKGLVVVIIIHDGENLPPELSEIQNFEIKKYFNPHLQLNSTSGEKFYSTLDEKTKDIVDLIEAAPNWNEEWVQHAIEEFQKSSDEQSNETASIVQPKFTIIT